MTYCERQLAPKRRFDKRSFRWKASGKARVLVACPRGAWSPATGRCKRGLRAYKVLVPATSRRCPTGTHRLVK